jgi:hypothetical protein
MQDEAGWADVGGTNGILHKTCVPLPLQDKRTFTASAFTCLVDKQANKDLYVTDVWTITYCKSILRSAIVELGPL